MCHVVKMAFGKRNEEKKKAMNSSLFVPLTLSAYIFHPDLETGCNFLRVFSLSSLLHLHRQYVEKYAYRAFRIMA